MKGLTFYVCIGKWAGFRFERSGIVPFRLVLGFVSLAVWTVDIEVLVDKLIGEGGVSE